MLAPLAGFLEREILGIGKIAAATNSGLAVSQSTADATPLTGGTYSTSLGTFAAATPLVTFTQSGTTPFAVTGVSIDREEGWLLQPVTSTGPSLLSILSQVYDESVAAGSTAAILLSKAGAIIGTDQYVSTGGTAIKFDGTVALGTVCGIVAGQPRVLQAGDAPRLKFLGKAVSRGTTLAALQIL